MKRVQKMKPSTLEILCCPHCKSSLSLDPEPGDGGAPGGRLNCKTCDRDYPIRDGIVHFFEVQELRGSNQRYERTYNRMAPFYSWFSKFAMLPFGGERKARMEILDHLDFAGGRTLEISIGSGVNLPYLYESPDPGEIYGIDISIGQLQQCQKLSQKRDWQVNVILAMAESLPFKTGTFDRVLHIGGINFFSDKSRAVSEMVRVARPGARVVIADEAERLAKGIDKSYGDQRSGVGGPGSSISKLVPTEMDDLQVSGIWNMHGRPHGYCLTFRVPE